MSSPTSASYRLPTDVLPGAYRIELAPDLDTASFTGQVAIDLDVVTATNRIVLNAAELEISSATLRRGDLTLVPSAVELNPEEEQVTLVFGDELVAGHGTLSITFTGILNDKLRGFYRSTFKDADGTEHVIATTQMQSTDARRAFPCWDEPEFKATFEITLIVAEGLTAVSNSPEVANEPTEDGRRRVRFSPTMVMSTYLVAFIVGPLEVTDPVDVDGIPLRIVHRPGQGHLTGFALEAGAHALRFFTEYFGIPYPAEKLDMAAIPDFAAGAMENLGCVTYRETLLLVDPAQASRVELQRITDVICHEIAHMWFGDLVTMKWWNGIWLNEAFATFMEVLACDAFRPEWERWVSFGVDREAAAAVDGLHATRPVEFPVGRPEEAEGMFDVLTYEKGGSVLRMLEQYLGAEVFRAGIHDYLTTHAYGNTETVDLWNALSRSSGQDVAAIMHTWIDQGGYPLVTVADDGTVAQEPFSYQATPGGAIGSDWQIPLLVRPLAGGATTPLLLADQPERPGDVLVNAGGAGFYRVAYPSATVSRLASHLDALTALERYNLVSDTWAASLAGRMALSDLFRLAQALVDAGETEPSVWSVIIGALGLCDRVVAEADRAELAAGIRRLLQPVAERLTWDAQIDDGERTPALRAAVLRALGTIGDDASVRDEADRRFQEGELDADLESAILDLVAADGGSDAYETFLARYRNPATPQEGDRYLYALAAFNDPELAKRTFDLCVTEVRTQNAPFVIQSMLTNRVNGPATWTRTSAIWEQLIAKFPSNTHARMLDGVRALCAPASLPQEIREFVAAHPLPNATRTVEQILERLAINEAFATREASRVAAALAHP